MSNLKVEWMLRFGKYAARHQIQYMSQYRWVSVQYGAFVAHQSNRRQLTCCNSIGYIKWNTEDGAGWEVRCLVKASSSLKIPAIQPFYRIITDDQSTKLVYNLVYRKDRLTRFKYPISKHFDVWHQDVWTRLASKTDPMQYAEIVFFTIHVVYPQISKTNLTKIRRLSHC